MPDYGAVEPGDGARGAPRMHRLHPMTLVQRFLLSIPALFVVLLPALRNPDANAWFSIGAFLLYGVFVVPLIVVQYLRFRYAVTPKEIIIHKGVFTYQHRNIPIERIQNIEIEQRLLPRMFGTAKVKIETAGSSSTEGVIEFVGMEEARSIRSTVQTYQRERRQRAPEAGPAAAGTEAATAAAGTEAKPYTEGAATDSHRDLEDSDSEPQEKLLHEMPVGRVVLSGAFRFSLLYIVVIFSATEYLGVTPEEITRWFTGDRFEEVIGVMESSPWLVAAATILMVALLAWITGLVTNFNRFYGFRLSREEGKLHTRYGLLTVSEGTIPLKKIQALVLRTNPLMSAFGWFRLELQTMGFDPDDRGYRIAAPFVRCDEAMAIAREIGLVEEPGVLHRVSRLMIRRTFVRYAVVLVLAACGVGYFWTPALWALAALPLLLYVAVQQFRHHGFRFSEEYLYVRRGVFRETLWIIPLERFQVFYLSRSIFQRRLGLASVYVDTPGAGVMAHPVVVDLPAEEAATLMYELYRRFQRALGSRRTEAPRLAGEDDFT